MRLKVVGTAYYCPLPVGSVYLNVSNIDPAGFWPGTVWERIASGTFLASSGGAASGDYAAGKTGGAASVTLTTAQMPSHYHVQHLGTDQAIVGAQGSWSTSTKVTGGYAATTDRTNAYQQRTASVGGGSSHENRPPYLAVDMWKRVS